MLKHPFCFIVHGFCAGLAKMEFHPVGSFIDFLHKHGRSLMCVQSGNGDLVLAKVFVVHRLSLR